MSGTHQTDVFRMIAENFSNLVELDFNVVGMDDFFMAELPTNLHLLSRLKSLKVFKLNLNKKSVAPLTPVLAKNATPIEHLELSNGIINAEAIKAISQMNRLKVVGLNNIRGLTDEHMVELAKGLGPQLEKMQLEGSKTENLTTIGLKKMLRFATKLSFLKMKSTKIKIDADDYNSMLDTVQKRPEKVALLLELTGRVNQVKVDETILAKNQEIFFIKEILKRKLDNIVPPIVLTQIRSFMPNKRVYDNYDFGSW